MYFLFIIYLSFYSYLNFYLFLLLNYIRVICQIKFKLKYTKYQLIYIGTLIIYIYYIINWSLKLRYNIPTCRTLQYKSLLVAIYNIITGFKNLTFIFGI